MDVSIIVDYGMPIQVVGLNVQENIRKSVESMTGLHVISVDVHVMGVSFEKENKELQQSQEMARLQAQVEAKVAEETSAPDEKQGEGDDPTEDQAQE